MVIESIREEEAREGWLPSARIKALKGEPQDGFGLKDDQSFIIPKGANRARYPTGARGRNWKLRHHFFGNEKPGRYSDPVVGAKTS